MIAQAHLFCMAHLVICVMGGQTVTPMATPEATPAQSCQITIPNGSTPPSESGRGWHGNDHLWVGLPLDGVLRINPTLIDEDGNMSDKIVWYRREIGAPLKVTAQLAGDPAIQARIDMIPYEQQSVQPIGITFPKEGCWEITGVVPDGSLAVTLWVTRS